MNEILKAMSFYSGTPHQTQFWEVLFLLATIVGTLKMMWGAYACDRKPIGSNGVGAFIVPVWIGMLLTVSKTGILLQVFLFVFMMAHEAPVGATCLVVIWLIGSHILAFKGMLFPSKVI